MALDELRAFAFGVQLDVTGVDITVTRPSPDVVPVETQGIWLGPTDDPQPYGADFNRVAPRATMVIPLSTTLPTVPNGTLVVAPPDGGGALLRWQVEGRIDADRPDEVRVFLRQIS